MIDAASSRTGVQLSKSEAKRLPTVIEMVEVMEGLGFTSRRQLADFGILCGGDFAGKLYGIGPVRAHAIIFKYGSLGRFKSSPEGKK